MYTESEGIKPGENYQIWKTPKLTPENFFHLTQAQQLKYLVTCGQLAASSHNTQPWGIKIEPETNSFSIFLDKERVLPASDIDGRQACISIGCLITNMSIATRYFGFTPKIDITEINPKSVKPKNTSQKFIPVANFYLLAEASADNVDRAQFEAIFTRRMNRGKYTGDFLMNRDLNLDLSQICTNNQVSLHTFSREDMRGRGAIRLIAEFQAQADNYVVNNQGFSDELGRWFFPNDTKSPLGMPGDTFGLQNEAAQRFAHGLLKEVELTATEKAGLAVASKAGIESASVIGGITASKDQPFYWIKAGMALQDIALTLEKNGLAMAVHAGLAEVSFVSRPLGLLLGTKEKLVTLFRTGKAEETRPHSPRLPIEKVVL
ncbi:MAG: hypothetical protein UT04_C0002G0020 [Candidatus Daviesbacteria bacterium GW2011_GWF2_38_7]|nr:MAG: hypothetical protein UT04_C0002G0020 [Candidatus Daviesbacteria bacterium GW2011_GWF2_38_7]